MINIRTIIPAAGSGLRIGGDTKKQYLCLNSKPIVAHTIEKLSASDLLHDIILVVPETDLDYCENEIVLRYNLTKVKRVVAGGKTRQESVYNGVKLVSPDIDLIMVHDAVRPFISKQLIHNAISEANRYGSAVLAVPENDTVKEVSENMEITKTLDRQKVWRIQTPQVFRRDILLKAYEQAIKLGFTGTDESSLVEQIGNPVKIIHGSYYNIKITVPEDILLGEYLLKNITIQ